MGTQWRNWALSRDVCLCCVGCPTPSLCLGGQCGEAHSSLDTKHLGIPQLLWGQLCTLLGNYTSQALLPCGLKNVGEIEFYSLPRVIYWRFPSSLRPHSTSLAPVQTWSSGTGSLLLHRQPQIFGWVYHHEGPLTFTLRCLGRQRLLRVLGQH